MQYEAFLDTKPEQNPIKVADALLALIDAAPGSRPQRTVVDFIGMAEPVGRMNTLLAQVTSGIYQAFGSDALLTLRGR